MLAHGADPDTKAKDGWSCLMMAVRDGSIENVRALFEHGADIKAGGDMFGRGAVELVQHGPMVTKGEETFDEAREKRARMKIMVMEYFETGSIARTMEEELD